MCNCNECNTSVSFGSTADMDVVYTGKTVECEDKIIVEQGTSIRESLESLADEVCLKSSEIEALSSNIDAVGQLANEGVELAGGANDKADEALQQIANLPEPIIEINPSDVGITLANSVPMSAPGNKWVGGGAPVSQNITANTIGMRHSGGRYRVGDAVEEDDAVTKRQLDAIGLGVTTENVNSSITNSDRSLILKSVNCTIIAPNNLSKQNVILNSEDSTIGGTYSHLSSITGSRHANIGTGERNFIAASDVAEIGNRRIQTAVIASTESVIENWLSQSSLKWNSAIIASRLGRIQSSNSYTLVTGKGNTSCGSAQMVVGQNNIVEPSRSVDDPLKKAFIVGNGVGNDDPNLTVKSNAFYVTQGGKAWLQNDLDIDKAGGGVVLKSPNGTRFLLSVGDDGSLGTVEI